MDTIEFLTYLWRGGAYGYYWIKQGERKVTRWQPLTVAVTLPPLEGGADVYFGVNPTTCIPQTNASGEPVRPSAARARHDILAAMNCLFSEFDARDYGGEKAHALQHIRALSPAPSVVIDSGGGYHAYWLLTEPIMLTAETLPAMRALQYRWVAYTGGDGGAKDLCRVLRVPGSRNYKPCYTEPPRVEFVDASGALYAPGDFRAVLPPEPTPAPRPQTTRAAVSDARLSYELERARAVVLRIVDAAPDGAKHDALYKAARLAGGYAAGGVGAIGGWEDALRAAIDARENVADPQSAYKTITDGLRDGQRAPLHIEVAVSRTPEKRARPEPPRNVIATPGKIRRVIPAPESFDPTLALPDGRWERLSDGSIAVLYENAWEMAMCEQASAAIRAWAEASR